MANVKRSKPGLKFLWSHQGSSHRLLVKIANRVLRLIPFSLKYAVGRQFKKNSVPYSLVKGRTVVQIGAPFDTLNAGRSRGMYFSQLVGSEGKVLIIEPLPASVAEFKRRLAESGLENTLVHEGGAWSSRGESFINVDMNHPATNFTGETVDYPAERVSQFEKIRIELNTVDNIVDSYDLTDVYLVSITTNWAEEEILKGMTCLIDKGVKYISLAYGKNGEDYKKHMKLFGFQEYSHDDRGVTFVKS